MYSNYSIVKKKEIMYWMMDNVSDYINKDSKVDTTLMVEDWDKECGHGEYNEDPNHPAWEIAYIVSHMVMDGRI